jgi:hypothetical protein
VTVDSRVVTAIFTGVTGQVPRKALRDRIGLAAEQAPFAQNWL